MDFIERWLGFSPDGGNGMFEAALLVCLAGALLVVGTAGRRRYLAKRNFRSFERQLQ